MRKASGMTLVEIVAVLAIMATLFAIAIGAWSGLIRDQRVKTAATDVFSSLTFARAEALKRNACAEVVPDDADDWSLGWQVQVPMSGGAPACGGTDTPLLVRRFDAHRGVVISGPATQIIYTGAGRLSVLGDTSNAALCNNTCSTSCTVSDTPPSFLLRNSESDIVRCVSVRSSGAPEVKKG